MAPARGHRVDPVDLLVGALAHVGDPEQAGLRIEAEAPWVAESNEVDLGRAAGSDSANGLSGGNRVAAGLGDVQAQDRAEQRGRILAIPERIPAGAAVPEPEPQVAVRPEGELAAVVVREGLIHGEEDPLAGGVEHGCRLPVLCAGELGQHRVAVAAAAAVVHEGPSVFRPVRMEHQPEQAALTLAQDAAGDVERDRTLPATDGHHAPRPLVDEEPAARRGGDPDRVRQAIRDDLQRDRRRIVGDRRGVGEPAGVGGVVSVGVGSVGVSGAALAVAEREADGAGVPHAASSAVTSMSATA